jgi:hypothetical protein
VCASASIRRVFAFSLNPYRHEQKSQRRVVCRVLYGGLLGDRPAADAAGTTNVPAASIPDRPGSWSTCAAGF